MSAEDLNSGPCTCSVSILIPWAHSTAPVFFVFLSLCWKYPWVNLLLLTLLISENGLYMPFLHFLFLSYFYILVGDLVSLVTIIFAWFHLNGIRYHFSASCSSCLCPCLLFLWTTLPFPLSAGLSNSSTMRSHPTPSPHSYLLKFMLWCAHLKA